MPRREFPMAVRRAVLKRAMDKKGIPRCEGCGLSGVLQFDHIKPDGLGGEPTEENCRLLCKKCHGDKTHKEDRPRMAKADRQFKRHFLSKHRKRRPLPGSRASGIRKRMDGTVERW